jgi:nucleoid DNA-binding protein
MRKADIVNKVAIQTELGKEDTEEIVDCLLHCIRLALIKGKKVTFVKFGTFKNKLRGGGVSNLKHNKGMIIPAQWVPTIKFSKDYFINKIKKPNATKNKIYNRLKLLNRHE